jgi:hypothetical protein
MPRKRPDVAERNRLSGQWLRGKKLSISDVERQARRARGTKAMANLHAEGKAPYLKTLSQADRSAFVRHCWIARKANLHAANSAL